MTLSFVNTIRNVFLACLLISAVNVAADDDRYRVVVVDDTLHGRALIRGNNDLAMEKISAAMARRQESFALYNNLCVAQMVNKDMDAAKASCAAAVEASKAQSSGLIGWLLRPTRNDQAVALLNRGVSYALVGESELARRDFAKSYHLKSSLVESSENLALLDAKVGTARTASAR